MLGEPWNTLLFLIVIPALIQLYKMYKDKGGKPLSKLALQVIALGLTGVFTYFNDGWVGIVFPALPVFGDDIFISLGAVITFAGEFVAVVGVAFGTMQALYELVLKRIFETVGLAATEKVISRSRVGFWA